MMTMAKLARTKIFPELPWGEFVRTFCPHNIDESWDELCHDHFYNYKCVDCWKQEVPNPEKYGIKKENKEMNKVEKHAAICNELTDLYARKNHDYGDSFAETYRQFGMAMPCIRLSDKLRRLISLTKLNGDKAQVSDESVRDTLMDLANYAIMSIIEMDKEEEKK